MEKYKTNYLSWILQRLGNGSGYTLMLILITLAISVVPVFVSYILRDFVNIATGDTTLSFGSTVTMAGIIVLVWGLLYIANSMAKTAVYCKAEGNLRSEFLHCLFTRDFFSVQKLHTGELMTLLSNDVGAAASFLPDLISGVIGNLVLALVSLTALFFLFWKLTLILLVAIPILVLAMNLFSPVLRKLSRANKDAEEHNRNFLQDRVGKMLLFKAYEMAENSVIGNNQVYALKRRSALKLSCVEGISGFMNIFLGMSLFLIVLGGGAYFVTRGEVKVGTLIAMTQLMNNVVNPFSSVSRYISQIAQSKASIDRIRKVMDLPVEQLKMSDSKLKPVELRTRALCYAYGEEDVLKGINLCAILSEKIGIIGESGSGKSTLAKLLMGLYVPKSGRIELLDDNGTLIENLLPFISYVPSDGFLFRGTIKENICMGKAVDEKRLHASAETAQIHDFILNLPMGYDEQIGEGSNLLSSGQAQRIGIARAIYRNSPVIIFDEPTSNLDSDTIYELHDRICMISQYKICLIITHDISTKNICDRIYSLNYGVASESHI